MSVEYWSGGQQLLGGGGVGVDGACNPKKIASLRPEDFSRYLLYHKANDKQTTIICDRLVLANTLLGQLNDARKRGEKRGWDLLVVAARDDWEIERERERDW